MWKHKPAYITELTHYSYQLRLLHRTMGLPLPTPLTIFILLMLTVQGNTARTVETVSSVLLQKGTRGLVPCQVNTTADTVFWSKSESFISVDDLLVYMDLTVKPYYREGPWYEEGTFNITNDLTLVIEHVKWTDAIVYFCTVYGQVDDSYTQRQTNATIFVLPTEQFPVIETCNLNRTGKANTIQQNCSLYESSPGRNVTCSVDGYFPTTTLYFRHHSETLTSIASSDWTNEDGTYGRSITTNANASFYHYECVCLAFGETVERTSTILIRNRPFFPYFNQNGNKSGYFAPIFPILLFYAMICLPVTAILKKRCKRLSEENRLAAQGAIMLFILPTLLVIAICMIDLGSVYFNDCSIRMIPLFLIIFGSVYIIFFMLIMLSIYQYMKYDEYKYDGWEICVFLQLMIFLPVFFIIGSGFIYHAYPIVQTEDEYDHDYCHPVLYYFSFSVITSIYIIFGLLCCCLPAVVLNEKSVEH